MMSDTNRLEFWATIHCLLVVKGDVLYTKQTVIVTLVGSDNFQYMT